MNLNTSSSSWKKLSLPCKGSCFSRALNWLKTAKADCPGFSQLSSFSLSPSGGPLLEYRNPMLVKVQKKLTSFCFTSWRAWRTSRKWLGCFGTFCILIVASLHLLPAQMFQGHPDETWITDETWNHCFSKSAKNTFDQRQVTINTAENWGKPGREQGKIPIRTHPPDTSSSVSYPEATKSLP